MTNTSIRRGWTWHLVLGAAFIVQLTGWFATRTTSAELEVLAANGGTQARLDALHVLGNRGVPAPKRFSGAEVQQLLIDPDPRMQRFAMINTVCKFRSPVWQLNHILAGAERADAAWWVDYMIQLRKVGAETVGAGFPMRVQELDWYLAALEGEDPPREEVLKSCGKELARIQAFLERKARRRARRRAQRGKD